MGIVALFSAVVVAPVQSPKPVSDGAGASRTEMVAGFRALRHHPDACVLVGVLGLQYVAIGALDVLFVVLAVSVLHLGAPGAGYLNAAFGAGGVLGIAATVALLGRPRLAPPLIGAILVWTAAFVVIGIAPRVVVAFALLVIAGSARSLFDVSARTLLQRTAPSDVLARMFGAVESLSMAGLAMGALAAPILIAIGGARLALVVMGLLLPAVSSLAWHRLATVDDAATVPILEIALLRKVRMLSELDVLTMEQLAGSLTLVSVAAGERIVREGDVGHAYFVVADGELLVTQNDQILRSMHRGEGFGEIALLKSVRPRLRLRPEPMRPSTRLRRHISSRPSRVIHRRQAGPKKWSSRT
jgi:hypothetical protein